MRKGTWCVGNRRSRGAVRLAGCKRLGRAGMEPEGARGTEAEGYRHNTQRAGNHGFLKAQRLAPASAPMRVGFARLRVCLRAKMPRVCVLILLVEVAQNPAGHLPAGLQTLPTWVPGPSDLKRKRAGFSGPRGAEARESGLRACRWLPSRGDWHHL